MGSLDLDVAALHHVNKLAVAQQGNGGRRWRKAGEVAPGGIGGFAVLSRKHA